MYNEMGALQEFKSFRAYQPVCIRDDPYGGVVWHLLGSVQSPRIKVEIAFLSGLIVYVKRWTLH